MEKRRRKEEEEEQAVEGLPNDLVWEFLSRVPYRSLCRFKSVSTSWLTLCSDPTVHRRSPQTLSGFFGLSRSGNIRFVNLSGRGRPLIDPALPFLHGFKVSEISVWILEDYASGRWTLKHTTSILDLLGRPCLEHREYYVFVALHPERNLIFFNGGVERERTLMSYDMDTQKLHVICNLEDFQMQNFRPYTPCFVEWPLSNAHSSSEQVHIWLVGNLA
ncbi:hypothetical protein VPH35_011793 [Triticum aestivum]